MKLKILTFFITLLISATCFAYDFVVDGIYYDILEDGKSVSVTFRDDSYGSYSGDVVIPTSVTYDSEDYTVTLLGNYSFKDCNSLTSITIPESVIILKTGCFEACTSLTSIIIPEGVIGLWDGCFYGCTSLASVVIPKSLTGYGLGCFSHCTSLTSIVIPEGVTGLWSGCFWYCTSLTNITLPKSLTTLGPGCFADCTSLTSITIPENVNRIDYQCFENCINLKEVICFWQNPISIPERGSNNAIFSNETFDNGILYVPVGMGERYRHAFGWRDFTNIVEKDVTDGINQIMVSSQNDKMYSLDGYEVKAGNLRPGIYVTRGKKFYVK